VEKIFVFLLDRAFMFMCVRYGISLYSRGGGVWR
jgi:hypothetical protein